MCLNMDPLLLLDPLKFLYLKFWAIFIYYYFDNNLSFVFSILSSIPISQMFDFLDWFSLYVYLCFLFHILEDFLSFVF